MFSKKKFLNYFEPSFSIFFNTYILHTIFVTQFVNPFSPLFCHTLWTLHPKYFLLSLLVHYTHRNKAGNAGGSKCPTRWFQMSNKVVPIVQQGGSNCPTRWFQLSNKVVPIVQQGGSNCPSRWFQMSNKVVPIVRQNGSNCPTEFGKGNRTIADLIYG